MSRVGRLVTAFVLSASCARDGERSGASTEVGSPTSSADYDAGAVAGGPGAGARYALGRTPTPTELALLDTDVGMDGEELPAGEGTASAGAALYAAQCAACHGAQGEGIAPNPALIGRDPAAEGFRFGSDPSLRKTIGNYWPYAPALFDYIRRAMPLAAPGSLSDDEVYALTAYLLAANGIVAPDATLDAEALRAVRMPYRDRFVPDDRTGGPTVR